MSFTNIEGTWYNHTKTTLIHLPANKKDAFVVPLTVQNIGIQSFRNCTLLQKVALPTQLKRIEILAFEGCKSLTELIIPESVNHFGYRAFKDCNSLKSIYLCHKIPPMVSTENEIFPESVTSRATLFVPKGTKKMYAKANLWKEFMHLKEYAEDELIKSLTMQLTLVSMQEVNQRNPIFYKTS
ncbi:MAG: hypothetical protein AUK44_05900 [Porphyromonadaceae bacterium CG2_30_38_12]|nr:MAG: hypothetical protein AUK44_05900 [Porphyromonadaceae bacterium CG2_30_38_12]